MGRRHRPLAQMARQGEFCKFERTAAELYCENQNQLSDHLLQPLRLDQEYVEEKRIVKEFSSSCKIAIFSFSPLDQELNS